jgi:ubiquinone/menaquinone biosynthesis C-methylase UbiE
MNKKTSWGNVANWYDEMLEKDDDSYQKNVILPNILRLVDPKPSQKIVDIACGQGYFSKAFAKKESEVIGLDISTALIDLAKNAVKEETFAVPPKFLVAPADNLACIPDQSADVATIILAIQNIENINGVFSECSRILKENGRLLIVINHPAFRIPKNSNWQWDEEQSSQFRRIDSYMSDQTIKIDMSPSQSDSNKKKYTISFHRPLQSYFKSLNKSGFCTTRLEEWISHKVSQKGPRSAEEDRVRKEIPLFMCIEATKISHK